MKSASAPLGVFDSGIGGLTVVRAIRQLLPEESIIYLGDTARVPYGNKSPETIRHFAGQICKFLVDREVKAIVIACNTASAHALPDLQKEVPVPVFGVIRPGVESALKATRSGRVGIIGTTGTIRSMAYQNALKLHRPDLHLLAAATPLLVPLIEENWLDHEATRLIVGQYCEPFRKESVDTLVLACTHYPLLKPLLASVMGEGITLVDSSTACASNLKDHLDALDQRNPQKQEGKTQIYLTDMPLHFTQMARQFLGEDVSLPQVIKLD